jgi:hypothetical protein
LELDTDTHQHRYRFHPGFGGRQEEIKIDRR